MDTFIRGRFAGGTGTQIHAMQPTRASLTDCSTPIVTSVVRALAILESFRAGETELSLAEIARRTSLDKTTALRLARTLCSERYLAAMPGGAWRIGPAAGWLAARYFRGFDRSVIIEPVLRELSSVTGESAAFFVREGNNRICVARVDGPCPHRRHATMGEVLPLEKGAPGRVLLAYSGESGEPYETIRRAGYFSTIGERDATLAAVSAPVFEGCRSLAGVISVTGPAVRFGQRAMARHLEQLKKAATTLSRDLGSNRVSLRHRA